MKTAKIIPKTEANHEDLASLQQSNSVKSRLPNSKGCHYVNCKNNRTIHHHLKFFKFPSNDKLRNAWVECSGNPKLLDLTPTQLQNRVICEEHFQPTLFSYRHETKTLLMKAIPINANKKMPEKPEPPPPPVPQTPSKLLIEALDKILEEKESQKEIKTEMEQAIKKSNLYTSLRLKVGEVKKTYGKDKIERAKKVNKPVVSKTYVNNVKSKQKETETAVTSDKVTNYKVINPTNELKAKIKKSYEVLKLKMLQNPTCTLDQKNLVDQNPIVDMSPTKVTQTLFEDEKPPTDVLSAEEIETQYLNTKDFVIDFEEPIVKIENVDVPIKEEYDLDFEDTPNTFEDDDNFMEGPIKDESFSALNVSVIVKEEVD